MRKNMYIAFIAIAIVTMMVHMVIPHHEHGEKVCFEQISCDAHHEAKNAHACCLNQQDIIRGQDDEYHYNCTYGVNSDVHFPPVLLFTGNFFDLEGKPVEIGRPYQNLYTSADVFYAHALRAPPVI